MPRAVEVATIVALRQGRVLLVAESASPTMALPGGKVEPGESPREAAARELREETAITVAAERLLDLELRIEVADAGVTLNVFALLAPPRARGAAELRRHWVELGRLAEQPLAPGVARSIHAALTHGEPLRVAPVALWEWWRAQRGELPWRATRDPYAVLVCEVMSQQTQIERVRERWQRWIARWPTIEALAAAELDEVLREWQGLGYPRRARDLLAAARRIAVEGWPADEHLRELPGVGPYTADALRCFAFAQPVLPRDANVRRVLARRFPGGLEDHRDPWSLASALMDLGRRHCRAQPRCEGCPLRAGCMIPLARDGFDPAARPPRQRPYAGSMRERRGKLLRAGLAGERPPFSDDPAAAASLLADGLLARDGDVLVAVLAARLEPLLEPTNGVTMVSGTPP